MGANASVEDAGLVVVAVCGTAATDSEVRRQLTKEFVFQNTIHETTLYDARPPAPRSAQPAVLAVVAANGTDLSDTKVVTNGFLPTATPTATPAATPTATATMTTTTMATTTATTMATTTATRISVFKFWKHRSLDVAPLLLVMCTVLKGGGPSTEALRQHLHKYAPVIANAEQLATKTLVAFESSFCNGEGGHESTTTGVHAQGQAQAMTALAQSIIAAIAPHRQHQHQKGLRFIRLEKQTTPTTPFQSKPLSPDTTTAVHAAVASPPAKILPLIVGKQEIMAESEEGLRDVLRTLYVPHQSTASQVYNAFTYCTRIRKSTGGGADDGDDNAQSNRMKDRVWHRPTTWLPLQIDLAAARKKSLTCHLFTFDPADRQRMSSELKVIWSKVYPGSALTVESYDCTIQETGFELMQERSKGSSAIAAVLRRLQLRDYLSSAVSLPVFTDIKAMSTGNGTGNSTGTGSSGSSAAQTRAPSSRFAVVSPPKESASVSADFKAPGASVAGSRFAVRSTPTTTGIAAATPIPTVPTRSHELWEKTSHAAPALADSVSPMEIDDAKHPIAGPASVTAAVTSALSSTHTQSATAPSAASTSMLPLPLTHTDSSSSTVNSSDSGILPTAITSSVAPAPEPQMEEKAQSHTEAQAPPQSQPQPPSTEAQCTPPPCDHFAVVVVYGTPCWWDQRGYAHMAATLKSVATAFGEQFRIVATVFENDYKAMGDGVLMRPRADEFQAAYHNWLIESKQIDASYPLHRLAEHPNAREFQHYCANELIAIDTSLLSTPNNPYRETALKLLNDEVATAQSKFAIVPKPQPPPHSQSSSQSFPPSPHLRDPHSAMSRGGRLLKPVPFAQKPADVMN